MAPSGNAAIQSDFANHRSHVEGPADGQVTRLLTDEHGDGAFKGNFGLILEPTYIHLDAKPSADVGGGSILARWLFSGTNTVRPYFEAGAGFILGQIDLTQTRCDTNFILEGGPGVLVFVNERTAVTVGYRFQHISNAGVCSTWTCTLYCAVRPI